MNEIKSAVEKYDELKELALRVKALRGTAISITGYTVPKVLLTDEGFDELFPLGAAECNIIEDADGTLWKQRKAEAEGVTWEAWTKLPYVVNKA